MTYPALKNLGINRPHEISGYTLSTEADTDTLRVRYVRQKGSLLPTSKRFKFPRRPMAGFPEMTEVSPALEAALAELANLLNEERSNSDKKADLLKEIDEFEGFIRTQLAEFRAEIEKL